MFASTNWSRGAAALLAVAILAVGNSAWAVVTSGQSSGYGISTNVTLGPAPQIIIVDTPSTGIGVAPAPFNLNANLPNTNFVSMFNGETIGQSVTGELDVNAGSNVDGGGGIRSATSDATVDNVSIQHYTQVPPIVPVTLDAVLDVNATQIQSTASVSGDFGALAPLGTASLSGTAGPGNDQASITVLGVEFLLDLNPLPNTQFVITQAQVPNLEGQIVVIQNEQTLVGDGATNQSISVNALHIFINSGMIALPPNFELDAWFGDIIIAHSEASLQAQFGNGNVVPEPGSVSIWLLLSVVLVVYAWRRRQTAAN